jgi:uncharacterized SAM-dependent methyltransferase
MSVRHGASRAHQPADFVKDFASDVQYYLTLQPKQLPSRYLYDDLGSALFEAICRLPWYGITRAEARMLEAHGCATSRPSSSSVPATARSFASWSRAARRTRGRCRFISSTCRRAR